MHAVMITFELLDDFDDAMPAFDAFTKTLQQMDDPVSTTWIRDRSKVGLFQLFSDADQADRYLASSAIDRLASHPACTDFYVERFETVDELCCHSPARQAEPVYA